MTFSLTDVETLAVGLAALVTANFIVGRIPSLSRINVPTPVLGGVLVAIAVALLHQFGSVSIQFSGKLTVFLQLVFFTTVGLSAKFSALKAGGKPLVILCVVVVILLIAQSVVGIGVAWIVGAHPGYGLLIGSISFVGGPATAAAWAQEAQAAGLERAPELAVGAATLAVVVGAIVSGQVTAWLVSSRKLQGPRGEAPASWVAPEASGEAEEPAPDQPAAPISSVMLVLLLIVGAVLAGGAVNQWARVAGLVLPGFLTAMLAGVAISNFADMLGAKFDFSPIERGGQIALQAFLVMYLMSLKLWTLGAAIGPLIFNLSVQVLVTVLIGVLLLFRWLGKDYDAAVTTGGFLGFGMSSMPVAMATMDGIAQRHGPSPKAFLLIALAGSFFVDLANALVVKAFLLLLGPAAG